MRFQTIPEMLKYVCEKYEDKDAYLYKLNGEYKSISYTNLMNRVQCFMLGMMEMGIHKGDKVGIVAENRIEWIIASFAINSIGAIDVPIFPILTSKQEEYIFQHSEATAVIVSNNFQLNKVMEFKDNIPSLRHIIVMNNDFMSKEVFVRSMEDVTARGAQLKSESDRKAIFEEKRSKINEDDLLTIIYTSGTTGEPKGVMLSHKNVVSNVKAAHKAVTDLEGQTAVTFLPLCHTFERMAGFYTLFSGGTKIAIAESIDSLPANMKEIKPTIIPSVPKFLETVKKRVESSMEREPANKQKVFKWAVNIGKKYIKNKFEGKSNFLISPQYALADKLVYSKIRERFGGNLKTFISGGAALPLEIHEFFEVIGIHVLQGYGLTEASPVISINTYSNTEFGTVGAPMCNVEVKIAPDGEILARGPNIMKGYWKDSSATRDAIDEEGWLNTGDIGIITEKGNIRITDRKKNIFVSSGGKNIAPQPIEDLISQSKYIDHCVLIGESREYCTALLTPNYEQLKSLAGEFGIEFQNEDELISDKKIVNHIKKDIDFLQKDLSKFERVRRFSLLSKPFTIESGELSPKLSIKRHVVEQMYSKLIETMYGSDS